jgi:hypothetical protein
MKHSDGLCKGGARVAFGAYRVFPWKMLDRSVPSTKCTPAAVRPRTPAHGLPHAFSAAAIGLCC